MAHARVTYTGDGAATSYTVTFPFINRTHTVVSVNGVTKSLNTDYVWLSDSVIQFVTAPPSGQAVVFQRVTSIATRLVDFHDAAILTEADLDLDSTQHLYLAQEAYDLKQFTMARNYDNNWDALSSRIINLAAPVDDADGANKSYVLSATATQVATATAQATIATDQAALASGSAADAVVATAAKVAAEAAETGAVAAQTAVELALDVSGLPTTLVANQFLKINSTATNYDLVSSVATPVFFGFKMSANGQEIMVDYGVIDADVNDYKTWTLGENIAFGVTTSNNLAYTI